MVTDAINFERRLGGTLYHILHFVIMTVCYNTGITFRKCVKRN